jgi:ubiquitin-protein ligase E3 C
MFVSPHYKLLPPASLQAYLRLSVALFNSFPISIFAPRNKAKQKSTRDGYDSDDSDDSLIHITVASMFQAYPSPLPKKTLKRLNTTVSAQHLKSIIYNAVSDQTVFLHPLRHYRRLDSFLTQFWQVPAVG